MRLALMMASILIISLLIFRGYSSGVGNRAAGQAGGEQIDPLKKAGDVNQLVLDAAEIQRRELEKQLRQ